MKTELNKLQRHLGLVIIIVVVFISQAICVQGQKLPPILKEGSGDPSAFDIESIRAIKAEYDRKALSTDDADRAAAKLLRNRLIAIGREQVDAMFNGYIKHDRKRRELIQFVLDFLEIGAAAAITLTNGERARTVISEGLGMLQASRTSLNKNFQLLERQVLINKMAADRATILTSILAKRDVEVSQYSWEDARADLRTYRDAGTIDGALINLSSEVGQQKEEAEEKLREVQDKPITGAATKDDLNQAESAFKVEDRLETELGVDAKKAAALLTLQKIVGKLVEDEEIAKLLAEKGVSTTTDDGMKIINALDDIKENATTFNRRDLVNKINLVIIDVGNQR
jgi:hypothetical protein